MVRRADVIVIATPTLSYSQVTKDGIETVTKMSIDEVIKGAVADDALNVVEPGGEIGELFSYVAGAPRFEIGERVLLFLTKTGPDRWSATDLVLGKFSFTTDEKGQRLLARDADEIIGWDPDLNVHRERARAEQPFLRFVREEVASRRASEDYFVDTTPATRTRTGRFSAIANATFTATSYTMTISGSQGSRWNVFPNGVTFYAGTPGEPGAPGNGTTAVQTAIASWDNDPGSNINYVYGGTDSTHTQGLHAADGANTVLFERDLSSWGVSPFTCTSNSYSGTLGLGGITSASGTHTLGSETFVTTKEGDVEMNRGLANCTLLFNNGDFNSAVAHEVGHTLGFRHSDQTRNSGGSCTTDATLECSNQAIMKSFVSQGLNGQLQAWDQHAAAAVYPGTSPPPPPTCTPPSITTQPQSRTITAGQSVTLTTSASGTAPLNYQWFQGTSGSTQSLVLSTGPSITVSPTTTTTYWVRVNNSCGRADSVTVTVTVNQAPVRGDFNGDGNPDLLWRNFSTGENRIWLLSSSRTLLNVVALPTLNLNWQLDGVGDIDGDGNQDIVLRNYVSGTINAWLMLGTVVRATVAVTGDANVNRHVESVNDFNGDGMPDFLWRDYATSAVYIWLMHHELFSSLATLPSQTDFNWQIEGSGDFDSDGKQDILWRNYSDGSNNAWLMNGTAFRGNAAVTGDFNVDRHIDAVADFSHDGKADLVWRVYSNGTDYIWVMNNTLFSSLTNLPTDTNLNWHIVGPR